MKGRSWMLFFVLIATSWERFVIWFAMTVSLFRRFGISFLPIISSLSYSKVISLYWKGAFGFATARGLGSTISFLIIILFLLSMPIFSSKFPTSFLDYFSFLLNYFSAFFYLSYNFLIFSYFFSLIGFCFLIFWSSVGFISPSGFFELYAIAFIGPGGWQESRLMFDTFPVGPFLTLISIVLDDVSSSLSDSMLLVS